MDLSVVIVNWNTEKLLLECLASVYGTLHDAAFEVWVVDNASTDKSVEQVRTRYPQVKIIQNRSNLGFAAANNRAFRRMQGRYALLLNTDATLTEGAALRLYRFMEENPEAALACGQLLNPDGSRQNSIANFPSPALLMTNETLLRLLLPGRYPSKRQNYAAPVEIESCIGACVMARAEAMNQAGLLDEGYFFFFEETDWACRMKQEGWKIYFVPDAQIYHAQGQSVGPDARGRKLFYRSRYRYLKKWFPRSYPFLFVIVWLRLLVNTLLAGAGTVLTVGLAAGLRKRFGVYVRLIIWHLAGCPAP